MIVTLLNAEAAAQMRVAGTDHQGVPHWSIEKSFAVRW